MKNKYILIAIAIIIVILLFVIGTRFLSGEDDWICQDGQWVKHGNPNAEMPTMPCK